MIQEYKFWTEQPTYPCTFTEGLPVLKPIKAEECETAERQCGLIAGTKVAFSGNLI